MTGLATTLKRVWDDAPKDSLATLGLKIIAAATALYALASLALPFGWDQGIIALVGSAYIHGGLPYVDGWDMKGPVAYIPYAIGELLFGRTMWGARLIDLLIWAGASFILYDGVRKLTTWRIGAGAALITYLWIASAGWFFSAAPEPWVAATCIAAIVPMLSPGASLKPWIVAASGALIACAGLVKPFYFGFGVAPLLSLVLAQDLSWWTRAKLAVFLALGALTPPLLVGGYYALHGGLAQAIEVHLLFPLSTYTSTPTSLGSIIFGVKAVVITPPILLGLPFALLAFWANRSAPRVVAVVAVWLVMALICVALQAKYYTYHWFPAYPAFFILAAMGVYAATRVPVFRFLPPGGGVASLIVLVCCALALTASVARPLRDFVRFAIDAVAQRDLDKFHRVYSFRLYNAADEIAAARYIAARTAPEEGLFVWGADATVAYLADRPNPTRFSFLLPLTMTGAFLDQYRDEAMQGLTARPPVYIVSGIAWDGLSEADKLLPDFPEFEAFLKTYYELETTIGALKLYRLRAVPAAVGAALEARP